MNDALLDRISPVTKRLRRVRFWRSITAIAVVAALVGWLLKRQVDAGQVAGLTLAMIILGVVVVVGLITAIVCRFSFRSPRAVALQIEDHFPSLDHRLLTALSQQDDQLGYLQQRVIKEARDHSRTHRWIEVVPSGRLVWSWLSGLSATAFLIAILGLLAVSNPTLESNIATRIKASTEVSIVPGDTVVERGTSLVVTARFAGSVPDQADLICVAADGALRRITMTQNLDDPVVGGFVSSVDQAFQYRVLTPNWESESFSVGVFEFPSLVRSDANLKFPDYTHLEEKRIEDTVRVSAVEGTQVTWLCYLNKSVALAELVAEDGTRIELHSDADWPAAVSTKLDLLETQRLTLELIDDQGRKNKYPPELIARVLPNQPPSLKLTAGGDISVSPLEEMPITAEVRDDFGITKVGLSFTFAQQPPQELTLGENIPRGARTKIAHMIAFEQLDAQPDQLLTYHFWAEDFAPSGEIRRTESDMFFAEVRPFEEIFREGEPPPGGQPQQQQQNQNGKQAEELAELQKEIINATWRVIREERGAKRSEKFAENVALLNEGQTDALMQLEELASKVRDEKSLQYVENVRKQMQAALTQLAKAAGNSDAGPLRPAMAAEQAAYGGLLKLRAREFQVNRSRRQQNQKPGSASQQRRQQQLDELELDQDENRYETQQQAEEASEEEQQQREIRQVLNRLRELARRQKDLNKELAQLQSALEQAETEEEKEEIERQLKRLRDQQQNLLRETDELSQRMQQPENQEKMAEASKKLDETRENVRRASDALQQNNAAEALTAGRRAEREFEELRDQFRQEAAGQFNDTVRQMRNDAQELDQKQDELAEQLDDLNQQKPSAGLRGNDRKAIEQDLENQRERLAELLRQMQETVDQAETAEPLLAQKLYDSYRKTRQRQVERQLRDAGELVRRGFDPQAREIEQGANEGIGQLREELEEAATSVLGDETKALQRALGELQRLERDLDDEIRRNQPKSSEQTQREGEQREGQRQGEENRQGGLLNRIAAESPGGAPLTGDGFREWSDRLREVEEMVENPELRSQAARIRDRARDVRMEFRRHSKDPQWELVDKLIAAPLRELRQNVSEELLRRSAEKHAPVPIDRDPVPVEFADAVRKYYESIGSGH